MKIKSGVDIVKITDFEKSRRNGGEAFLQRLFSEKELDRGSSSDHLAGVFAAKEAVIKALGLKAGDWRDIEVTYEKSGRPLVVITTGPKLSSWDLSISNTKDTAVAIFIAIV